jgi:glucose/arabinose dehydrogenase
VSACRSLLAVAFALSALAGCSSDDEDTPTAESGGQARTAQEDSAPDEQGSTAAPAQRGRPVRLLLLGNFESPTYIAAPRGDRRRRFVVQREGSIVVVSGQRRSTFLDISDLVSTGGESGLLSMAFARDYRSSGRFFVYYTDNQGFIQIDQFRRSANPSRADPASRRSVLRVPHQRFNHKGGQLQVGPDGMLYAGFGDGGGGGDPDENAQNVGRILGKLIRIDPLPGGGYDIPVSNPFRGRDGARGEVYAYGLRNPYRFSFDRRRGHLTIGDVGQDEIEEIDFVPGRDGGRQPVGGYNFGWDVFEGRNGYESGNAPGHVPPVIAHDQSGGYCSIIGGYVVRDPSLQGTGFSGRYVYGDLCNPTLRLAFLKRPSAPTRSTGLRVSNLVSFGEDGRGRVYAVSLSGPVYRIGRG